MTPIIPYHKNQKFGIVDVELNFLIECKYFQILKPFKFNQGWLCFTLNERKRYGWIYYENGQIQPEDLIIVAKYYFKHLKPVLDGIRRIKKDLVSPKT